MLIEANRKRGEEDLLLQRPSEKIHKTSAMLALPGTRPGKRDWQKPNVPTVQFCSCPPRRLVRASQVFSDRAIQVRRTVCSRRKSFWMLLESSFAFVLKLTKAKNQKQWFASCSKVDLKTRRLSFLTPAARSGFHEPAARLVRD